MVRPVRDILGENTPPLQVGEPPRVNGSKAPGGSVQTQVGLLVNYDFHAYSYLQMMSGCLLGANMGLVPCSVVLPLKQISCAFIKDDEIN